MGTKVEERAAVEKDDEPCPELGYASHDVPPSTTDGSERVRKQGVGGDVVLPFPYDMFLTCVIWSVAYRTFFVSVVRFRAVSCEIVENEGEYD